MARSIMVRVELDRESRALLRLLGECLRADPVLLPDAVKQAARDAAAVLEERRG